MGGGWLQGRWFVREYLSFTSNLNITLTWLMGKARACLCEFMGGGR